MTNSLQSSDSTQSRLDSWKAIAGHLGRSLRTVQRWHALYNLPVYHVVGKASGVFAYSTELDEWLRLSKNRLAEEVHCISLPSVVQMHPDDTTGFQCDIDHMENLTNRHSQISSEVLVSDAYALLRIASRNGLSTVARLFRQAIDLDRSCSEAYAGLSQVLLLQGLMGNVGLESAYSAAQSAASRALDLNPDSAEANCARAWIKTVYERDWEGAHRIFDVLTTKESSDLGAVIGRALLYIAQGTLEDASVLLYEASRKNLLSGILLALHSWCDYLAGKHQEVIDHLGEARESGGSDPILVAVEALTSLQLSRAANAVERIEYLLRGDPQNEVAWGALGYAFGASGDMGKARGVLERLNRDHSHAKDRVDYALALAQLGVNDREQAIASFERSFRAGSLWSLGFASDPVLRNLRSDLRFRSFLESAQYRIGPRSQNTKIATFSQRRRGEN